MLTSHLTELFVIPTTMCDYQIVNIRYLRNSSDLTNQMNFAEETSICLEIFLCKEPQNYLRFCGSSS